MNDMTLPVLSHKFDMPQFTVNKLATRFGLESSLDSLLDLLTNFHWLVDGILDILY
jgi:hypothetical protein